MILPIMHGHIARRLLINFRVDPTRIAALLPAPFRPKLLDGQAVAGICLIRLQQIRPRGLPASFGVTSENAAHRIAVEWDAHGQTLEGVYIPRRDTSSRLNTLVGGRLFPGMHHHARFTTTDDTTGITVQFHSDDGHMHAAVMGHATTALAATSAFPSLAAASQFFERGAVGYSVTSHAAQLDGLELRSVGWNVAPFAVHHVESSFFGDQQRFPPGSIHYDCALIMRNIVHEWHACGTFACVPQ